MVISSLHCWDILSERNITDYKTPFGSILIGIDTRQICVEEREEQIHVNVDYALEVNYEHLADCQISMAVRAKEGAQREQLS